MTFSKLPLFILAIIIFSACQQTSSTQTNHSQKSKYISEYVKTYIDEDADKIALLNAKVIDGTGKPAKEDQTILIENQKITKVGKTASVNIPDDFKQIDLTGKTVIPGIVGTHNHMRIPRSAMLFTSPRLYLAAGVTTIQTCGTGNPLEELEIGKAIKAGKIPGPQIVNSGPYLTGPEGKTNFIRFTDEKMVRDTIRYWAEKGAKWFKVYRHTRPQDLAIIIDEAHKHDAKVTGHLCATTFQEAAKLGIDAIEHGFIHSYDHEDGKEVGVCSGGNAFRSEIEINSDEVKAVHKTMIKNNVALSSTLSIFETQARMKADQRALELLAPFHKKAHEDRKKRKEAKGDDWYFKEEWLKKSMEYELVFFKAGGLLTAGLDPGWHNVPGFGDQKNYELFIEAGFSPEEAIQVMTSNGAKLLELENIGKIEEGMSADLVILEGDLITNSTIIRQVKWVFKDGKAYNPTRLIEDVKGNLGSENDNSMTYFGLKAPDSIPKIFAPNFISKPDDYEFGSIFSKDATEFFYGVDNGKAETRYSKLINGVWSEPKIILSHPQFGMNDPMLSPDENRLYFISNLPLKEGGEENDYDIWYVEREGSGWSKPINAGEQINSEANEYYMSFTENGTMYFSSNIAAEADNGDNFDIYRSEFVNGEFQKRVKLDTKVNSSQYEADVFVAPDESYLIFCGTRNEGIGRGDLYISFKNEDNSWTKAKNMGPTINTKGHELCPFVSADGKFLFFTSNKDIYWVDAKIIENYR